MTKRYLETPEAVIKALKEGKEIKDNDGHSYKIVNGFIVNTNKNYFFVGDIFSGNSPYILEEKPLKIELGKWYETRDHKKARCYYSGKTTAIFSIDNSTPIGVYLNGRLYEDMESSFDIIGPWEQ